MEVKLRPGVSALEVWIGSDGLYRSFIEGDCWREDFSVRNAFAWGVGRV